MGFSRHVLPSGGPLCGLSEPRGRFLPLLLALPAGNLRCGSCHGGVDADGLSDDVAGPEEDAAAGKNLRD